MWGSVSSASLALPEAPDVYLSAQGALVFPGVAELPKESGLEIEPLEGQAELCAALPRAQGISQGGEQ